MDDMHDDVYNNDDDFMDNYDGDDEDLEYSEEDIDSDQDIAHNIIWLEDNEETNGHTDRSVARPQLFRHCLMSHNDYYKYNKMYFFKPLHLIKCHYKSGCCNTEYPSVRSGHRVVATESHLYSLGGYNPNRNENEIDGDVNILYQELWSYNFAVNRWKLLLYADRDDIPRELASNALTLFNNVLISHGGTGYPFGENCSNECYVFSIGENPKVKCLTVRGNLPTAQYGPAIAIHNNYLYTIGGTTGFHYTCDVYRLNLTTKIWEMVYISRPDTRDPEGRYRHEVVYDGHYIYILGGGTSNTVYDLQNIPGFNLKRNIWEYFNTLPDNSAINNRKQEYGYPKPRKCLSCVQHTLSNGDIEAFITGGLQGDFTTYFNDIWKLNMRTKQWSKIHTASLPHPLYFHSAAHAGNGCMYIFGGIEYAQNDIRRHNDLFKMWITIPKLSEICWEAITFYNEGLHKYPRDSLLQMGIPNKFVNRLPFKPMA